MIVSIFGGKGPLLYVNGTMFPLIYSIEKTKLGFHGVLINKYLIHHRMVPKETQTLHYLHSRFRSDNLKSEYFNNNNLFLTLKSFESL